MRAASAGPVLAIAGLAKTVGDGRILFDGLTLDVVPGELVAIMGESGVGKSTLLNIVAGLDRPDRGSVSIGGVPLATLKETQLTALRRDRIGFVFQAFHILPYLTLRRNVALPLALRRADAATIEARADAMLAAVGVGGRGGDYPRDLSGGELQRIAIARALVHDPVLILADEPTGNLDPDTAARILALFGTQVRERGAGGLIVTHSEKAAAVADRVLILSRHGLVAP